MMEADKASYGSMDLDSDIEVLDNILIIICSGFRVKVDKIDLDLNIYFLDLLNLADLNICR